MSDKPDDLAKTTDPKTIELTEEEVGRVSGGYYKIHLEDPPDKVSPLDKVI